MFLNQGVSVGETSVHLQSHGIGKKSRALLGHLHVNPPSRPVCVEGGSLGGQLLAQATNRQTQMDRIRQNVGGD